MSDDPAQPKLGPHGGPRTKGVRSPKIMPSGSRRDYILARLERDGRHDLAEAIREGRASAYSIAVELGWTKRAEPVSVSSSGLNAAKRRQHQLRALTGEGLSPGQMMELKFGPGAQGSLFSSSEELRHAWEASRDEIMHGSSGGHRAQAWWCFDAPSLGLTWPGYFNEQSYLFDHNALGKEECAELVAFWRREFERAYDPDFSFTAAPGILHGVAAQKAHLDWADVPKSLRQRWTAARRRRERRMRGERQPAPLVEAAAPK